MAHQTVKQPIMELTDQEKQLIQSIRDENIPIPSKNEIERIFKDRTMRHRQRSIIYDYVNNHHQSLSGAISLILGTLLHQDGTFEHYGAQKAFQVLYQFNSLLHPPHDIDI